MHSSSGSIGINDGDYYAQLSSEELEDEIPLHDQPLLGEEQIEDPALYEEAEEAPLAPPAPKSWYQNLWQGTKNVAKKAWAGAKKVGIAGVAAVTALPSALNGLTYPSGKSPADIGYDWWHNMSFRDALFSVANGCSSFTINFFMNALFISSAWDRLKNIDPRDAKDILSIIGGLGGAISLAAISFESFIWAGTAVATGTAGLTFAVMFASRFLGVRGLLGRFSADERAKNQFLDYLKYIHPDHQEQFEHGLNLTYQALCEQYAADMSVKEEDKTKRVMEDLIQIMAIELSMHPEYIRNKTTTEKVLDVAGTTFDVGLGLLAFGSGYMAFAQKGVNGFKTIGQALFKSDLSHAPLAVRHILGAFSGIPSAALYAISAAGIRPQLTSLVKMVYQRWEVLPALGAATLTVANTLGASGPEGIAHGIVNHDNIFGLKPGTPPGKAFEAIFSVSGGETNFKVSAERALPDTLKSTEPLTLRQLENSIKAHSFSSEEVRRAVNEANDVILKHCRQALMEEETQLIPDATRGINGFRNYGTVSV